MSAIVFSSAISATSIGCNSLTATGALAGLSLTDGVMTATLGALSAVTDIGADSLTATGAVEGLSLTDGTATLSGGSLTGVSMNEISTVTNLLLQRDGTSTVTSVPIETPLIATLAAKTDDNAALVAILSGNLNGETTALYQYVGSSSSRQLTMTQGITYWEISYASAWDMPTGTSACTLTCFKLGV